MATIKEITYECDICKRKSKSKDFYTGNESGSAILSINGHYGAMSYNGDWGGANYSDKFEICFSCSEKIKTFIGSMVKQ